MHYYPSIDTVRVFDAHDQNRAMEQYPFHFRGNNAVLGPLNEEGDPLWIDFKR